ncbi:MAG: hypothetical protein MUP85_14225, partial [Candidatus Lokiarchaeota archaeon]|nr:hypothetical protein [Candidatus Lokiarchaeota archaeon]
MEENENQSTPEEIEKQKEIVDKLYKKEKEERDEYFKEIEEERKKNFEESMEIISGLISEQAFLREKHRQEDLQRMELNPQIER